MFTFRERETTTTTTTTTAKPKSLQELRDRSHGGVSSQQQPTTTETVSEKTTKRSFRNQLSSNLRAKLQKAKEKTKTEDEKEVIEEGKKVPETNRISNSYKDRFKIKDLPIKSDDVSKFLPKDYKVSSSLGSEKSGDSLLRELLSSLNNKDIDILTKEITSTTDSSAPSSSKSSSRPSLNRFTPRAPASSSRDFSKGYRKKSDAAPVQLDDISKFLPADYSTTSTSKPKLGLSTLFDDIETDLPSDLLPKDFKPKFTPKVKQEEISSDLLPKDYPGSKIETIALADSFLPKDYKNVVNEEISSDLLPKDFVIKPVTDVDPSLLPPGYDPSKIPAEEDLPVKPKVITDSSLLPPDFKFAEIDPSLLPKGYNPSAEKKAPEPKQDNKKLIKFNFW